MVGDLRGQGEEGWRGRVTMRSFMTKRHRAEKRALCGALSCTSAKRPTSHPPFQHFGEDNRIGAGLLDYGLGPRGPDAYRSYSVT